MTIFFLQNWSDDHDAFTTTINNYSDGYALRLKYSFAYGSSDGTYGACLTSATKTAQTCWTIDIASSAITGTASKYVTSPANNLDLSGESAVTTDCPWMAGFLKTWIVTYTEDSSNFHITGWRFLPDYDSDSGVSPSGDYRFSPNNDQNKDAATDIAAWVYTSPATWGEYAIATVEGATQLVVGAASAATLLMSF